VSAYLKFVLVLVAAFLLVVASVIGYAIGDDKEALADAARKYEVTHDAYLREVQVNKAMGRILKDRETLPDIAMREFNASQTVTFTLDGRKLRCIALLNKLGDATTLACDWDAWRR
jgi:hypothetical protein